MSSACGACTNDIFIARDCSFRLAISAKHATCVARDLPWKLRSLSADLLGAMLLLPSAPRGLKLGQLLLRLLCTSEATGEHAEDHPSGREIR